MTGFTLNSLSQTSKEHQQCLNHLIEFLCPLQEKCFVFVPSIFFYPVSWQPYLIEKQENLRKQENSWYKFSHSKHQTYLICPSFSSFPFTEVRVSPCALESIPAQVLQDLTSPFLMIWPLFMSNLISHHLPFCSQYSTKNQSSFPILRFSTCCVCLLSFTICNVLVKSFVYFVCFSCATDCPPLRQWPYATTDCFLSL